MAVECRLVSYDPETCRLVGEIVNVSVDERVLDADGNSVSTNNRKNYVVLDEDVLTAIATIRTDAAAHLEG